MTEQLGQRPPVRRGVRQTDVGVEHQLDVPHEVAASIHRRPETPGQRGVRRRRPVSLRTTGPSGYDHDDLVPLDPADPGTVRKDPAEVLHRTAQQFGPGLVPERLATAADALEGDHRHRRPCLGRGAQLFDETERIG